MTVTPALVNGLAVVEAVVLVLLAAVLTLLTALREGRRRRRRAAQDAWLARVRAGLADDGDAPRTLGVAPRGPRGSRGRRRQVAEVSFLTESLSGAAAEQVIAAVGQADVLAAARRWCRSRWWWRRLRGVRTLTNLSLAGVSGVNVTAMLDDRHPEVRAEAAASVARTRVTGRAIDTLVAMLDGEPRGRWAAADALVRIGEPAVGALAAHLEGGPRRPEIALRVAAALGSGRLAPVALAACDDRRASVRATAAGTLAAIGGSQAAQTLVDLLHDDAPAVREAAARGLGTLEHWPAAGALAQLLGDPVWEVRRSAAAALRLLGPAGRLHLRRATTDPDDRIRQIARHVADLPASVLETSS